MARDELRRTQKYVEALAASEGRELKLEAAHRASEWAIRFEGEVRAGDRRLFSAILNLERQARVWLQGSNGAGKTSLINTVLGNLTIPLLFVPQVISHEDVVGSWRGLPTDLRQQAMQVSAALLENSRLPLGL